MSKKTAKIKINQVILGDINFNKISYNTNYAQCYNQEATSASVKCILPSSLDSIKAVESITPPYINLDLTGFNTEVKFSLDVDYNIPPNIWPQDDISKVSHTKTILLEAQSIWQLNDNSLENFELSSNRVKNMNSIEATLPPSSCFNIFLKDNVASFNIKYTAKAIITLFEDGYLLSNSYLQSLVSGISTDAIVENQLIRTDVNGELIVKVIGNDYSEISPCN